MPPARFALILVMLLSAVLRLYNLGAPSLWWDEANTMNAARWMDEPDKWLDTAYINEAPLYLALAHLWDGLIAAATGLPVTAPARDFLLRLLPFAFGMVAMPLLYAVARRLTGSVTAALIAVLLFAVSPFQVHYAQELRVYSLHLATGLAAVYAFLRVLEDNKTRWWLALVGCEALLVYGHYIAVWVVFCLNACFLAWLVVHHRAVSPRAWLIRWTGWHLLMMLLILPALYHAWRCNQHLLLIEYSWYPNPTLRSLYISFKNFYYGYGPNAAVYKALLLLMLGSMALGAWRMRGRTAPLAMTLLLVLGPVLINWVMWRLRDFSMYEDRLFIFSAALSLALAGAGVAALRPVALRAAVLAALLALSGVGLADYYAGRLHPLREHRLAICDKVDFRSAAAYLEGAWQEGDLLAHDSNFTAFPMQRYFSREQAHLGATPEDAVIYVKAFGNQAVLENLGAFPVLAEEATRGRHRVWYIEAQGVTADDVPQTVRIGDWLAERYRVVEEHQFDGLKLWRFER
ncbi:MAG: hypothetical protein RLZZ303_2219 [Candidatus Hydrogenedentota bacterium]|jgi:4-amino-4-deoxy-L-arabinose transferase-like glycosyltransferase